MTEDDEAARVLQNLAQYSAILRHRQSFLLTQRPSGDAQIFRLTATRDLVSSFDEINWRAAHAYANLAPLKYNGGRVVPEGHVMWVKTSEVPLLDSIQLDSHDGKELIADHKSGDFQLRNLKLTITASDIRDTIHPVLVRFFRIMRPSARLGQQNKLAAWFTGNAFDRLDREVLLFPMDVDALSIENYTYFTNAHNFIRSFQFAEQMRAAARETFDTVLTELAIDGLEEFRRVATSDLTMVTKMTSIQQKMEKYPQYRKSLTMENLLRFIDSHSSVDIELEGSGSGRRFKFSNDPKRRFKILKLLDDDFLRSDLTKFDYEVDSKGDPST
jgi:Kiwa KwaB-like protein